MRLTRALVMLIRLRIARYSILLSRKLAAISSSMMF
ncbi:hypothetical protein ABIF29_003821 [Bradyrhizobium elkanii]|uniref:Uncharacterized protein n=1 Tax=Bradyrhizobium elkanii TaxID=29448 RepID=A0ABV4F0R0_BRAEL|nr:hypothetical protein [Bradyrhizobium elkanii]MCP1983359.1 hypothetical protein [Bradyrhizobium elkanii]MCS3881661.1 hypothetical protein [Bradyrhizobium elkanii]MCS4218419.1 hypothetical protein [Bradyrhizobium elkanii]MCW2194283.1 hypothetical protein [Bradyrhizobium elkanii]